MKKEVPKSLRIWFLIHFVVGISFGISLIAFPRFMMNFFNFYGPTALARMVGAALFAIGAISLLTCKEKKESYNTILTFNIVWSITVITALLCSIFSGETIILWFAVGVFFIFFLVWVYYKARLKYGKY